MDIFLVLLTILMLLVIYFDITNYIIPNWLNGVVLLTYAALFLTVPGLNLQSALLAIAVVFGVGFVIFAMHWMGGGDIKLMVATAPYIGFSMALLDYMVIITLLGGVLSVLLWGIRKAMPIVITAREDKPLPRIFQIGAPVPYGLAIAGTFLYWLWAGQVAGINISY